MKFSQYNIVTPASEGKLLLYNTFTGSVAKISQEAYSTDNKELASKGFIVDDNENELETYKLGYYANVFATKDFNLTVATTMACNLRCPYCFEEGGKSNDVLGHEVEQSVVALIKSRKDKNISITWFGGEPLVNFASIERISEAIIGEGIIFSASMITNGTLFTEPIIKKLDTYHIQDIQITLDGPRDIHDQKRFFHNKKGTFDIIIHNVRLLVQLSHAQITLKTNIDRNNASLYCDLKKYLLSQFSEAIETKRVVLDLNSVRNRTDFDGNQHCMSEMEFAYYKHNVLGETFRIPFKIGACPLRSISSLVIGPDGNIYKCLEQLGHKEKAIGNIVNGSYSLSKMAHNVFCEDPFADSECTHCNILPICGGGCPIDRIKKAAGNLTSTCTYLRTNIDKILREIYS